MRARRRITVTLLAAGVGLAGCQSFSAPHAEPNASGDVLDAIYAGMKRAQEHPDAPPAEPAPPGRPS